MKTEDLLCKADKKGLLILAFIIIGIAAYANTLDAPFEFDDQQNIVENTHIRMTSLTVPSLIEAALKSPLPKRPVANISFALNYYFGRYNVRGYHAVNIIIHVLTGIFLYLLLHTTLTLPEMSMPGIRPLPVAFLAALFWLIHPVQTQSVTYIVQRMNSMAAMFYILSLLLYVKGRLAKRGRPAFFAACLLSGLLALGSKEIAVTLPFFIILYEWYFLQDLDAVWIKRRLPLMAAFILILCLLGWLYLGKNPLARILTGYDHRDFSLSERLLTEFRVVIYYIGLLLYPNPSRLNLDHEFAVSHSLFDPFTTPPAILTVSGLLIIAIRLARRERLLSFCILWFFGNLVIESSVIGLELIFEHRIYLPSMFFCTGLTVLALRRPADKKMIIVLLSAVIILLCVWTHERNEVWRDPLAFCRDCALKAPNKARPHYNLGRFLQTNGNLTEAAEQYRWALRINPDCTGAHNNLGQILKNQRRFDEALSHYREAIRSAPDQAEAYNNIGELLIIQEKTKDAVSFLESAIRINPNLANAHYNLGLCFIFQGKINRAIREFRISVSLDPDAPANHFWLGFTLMTQNKSAEAAEHLAKALKLRPGYKEARKYLDIVLRKDSRPLKSKPPQGNWSRGRNHAGRLQPRM